VTISGGGQDDRRRGAGGVDRELTFADHRPVRDGKAVQIARQSDRPQGCVDSAVGAAAPQQVLREHRPDKRGFADAAGQRPRDDRRLHARCDRLRRSAGAQLALPRLGQRRVEALASVLVLEVTDRARPELEREPIRGVLELALFG